MSGTSADRQVPVTAVKAWRIGSATNSTYASAADTLGSGVADISVTDIRTATPGTAKEPQSVIASGKIVGPIEDGTLVCFKFFGVASDNGATASGAIRIWLWEKIVTPSSGDYREQWTKHLAATLTLTFGTKVGISGGIIDETQRYVDTIAVVLDGGFTGTPLYARKSAGTVTADNEAMAVCIDGMGCSKWEVEGTLSGASNVTSWNVMTRVLASA